MQRDMYILRNKILVLIAHRPVNKFNFKVYINISPPAIMPTGGPSIYLPSYSRTSSSPAYLIYGSLSTVMLPPGALMRIAVRQAAGNRERPAAGGVPPGGGGKVGHEDAQRQHRDALGRGFHRRRQECIRLVRVYARHDKVEV